MTPYKGLAAFGDSDLDALLFFGRGREIEVIVANLIASRLTVLYGATGVGKSSILRAGVAHRLRQDPDVEVIVWSTWTGDSGEPVREARRAAAQGGEVFLVLDQFEEYFLYHRDEHGAGTLAGELPELLGTGELRINVLISLREDALAQLDSFKGRIPNLFANHLQQSNPSLVLTNNGCPGETTNSLINGFNPAGSLCGRGSGFPYALLLADLHLDAAVEPLVAWCTGAQTEQRHRVGYLALALLRVEPATRYLLDAIRAHGSRDAAAAARALATFKDDSALVEQIRAAAHEQRDPDARAEIAELLA